MRALRTTLCTWFGSGFFPFASGTAGTIATIPLVLLLWWQDSLLLHAAVTILVTIVGLWAAADAEQIFGKKDPGQVVIDETAGYLVATIAMSFSWPNLLLSFLLFRAMDIIKPFPARRLEDLRGSWGIMLDDLVAGLYANLLLRLCLYVWDLSP